MSLWWVMMKQKRDSKGRPVIILHFVDPVSVANIAKNGFISFCPVLNFSGLISQTLSFLFMTNKHIKYIK